MKKNSDFVKLKKRIQEELVGSELEPVCCQGLFCGKRIKEPYLTGTKISNIKEEATFKIIAKWHVDKDKVVKVGEDIYCSLECSPKKEICCVCEKDVVPMGKIGSQTLENVFTCEDCDGKICPRCIGGECTRFSYTKKAKIE